MPTFYIISWTVLLLGRLALFSTIVESWWFTPTFLTKPSLKSLTQLPFTVLHKRHISSFPTSISSTQNSNVYSSDKAKANKGYKSNQLQNLYIIPNSPVTLQRVREFIQGDRAFLLCFVLLYLFLSTCCVTDPK